MLQIQIVFQLIDEETLLGWMEHENTPFFPNLEQLNDYLTTRDDILILE
jgi:hypothetical protein